jgi:hypothetical protein
MHHLQARHRLNIAAVTINGQLGRNALTTMRLHIVSGYSSDADANGMSWPTCN